MIAPSFALVAVLLGAATTSQAQEPAIVKALAPTGTLRAAINYGNPVLAQRGPAGEARGVSVVLATALAKRLGVPLTIVPFDGAGKVTDSLPQKSWDIAFLARDPVRGQGLHFTEPYVLIEGGYAVRAPSHFHTVESVDAPGVKIGVAKGSAYDLFLTREIKHATLVREGTGNEAVETYLHGHNDVLAGVKSPLAKLVEQHAGLRLLPGRFMAIEQTMATPKDRSDEVVAYLRSFVEEMKHNGTVARALAETGQHDAEVAP